MVQITKVIQIRQDQENWIKTKTREQFNFSKFSRDKLDEYIESEKKINKLKQKLEEDA